MKNIILTISILLFSICAMSQIKSNYAKGFEVGFKEGYCYNNGSSYDCWAPITPLAPLPRINERQDSYTDGYNRGFQYGLDLKRSNDALKDADINLNQRIVKFNEYISQNPVIDAMTRVGMHKQKMYDLRKEWIQERIDGLAALKNSLYNEQTLPNSINAKATNEAYWQKVKNYVNSIRGYDFADDYQFNSIQSNFNSLEKYLYDSYNEIIRKYQPVKVAQESKSEVVERPINPNKDKSTNLENSFSQIATGLRGHL